MQLFGKRTARQKEIRRSKAERGLAWYHRLARRIRLGPLLALLVLAGAAAAIVNIGDDVLNLRIGQRVPRDLTSRVPFRVEDEARTRDMRASARNNAEDYYTLDTSLLQDIHGRLVNALRLAREQAADSAQVRKSATDIKVIFDDAGLAEIMRLAQLPDSTTYQKAVDRVVQSLRRQPLVDPEELARRRTGINAVLEDPDQSTGRPVPGDRLLYANNAAHADQVATDVARQVPEPLQATVHDSLLAMLRGKAEGTFRPLYRYNTARSAKAAQDAENSVPIQYVEFPTGTRLADAGPISEEELRRLKQEHSEYVLQLHAYPDSPHAKRERQAAWGRGLIAFLVVFGLCGYMVLLHEDALGSLQRRLATALTILFVLVLARVIDLNTPIVHLAVGVQAFAIAILALASPRGAAYAAAGLLSVMIAVTTREGVGFVIMLFAVSLVLLLGLRDIRSRGQIIVVGAFAAVIAAVTTLLPGLMEGQDIAFVLWKQALWSGVTTLAAAFIAEGILPGIERLFGVTTSLTLLEWCDPNKPLLRMLAAESPGTYNHSLLVGTLADAAADAVEANGLLARTGAYYHDIGKISKPEYFVENQAMGVDNRHERLSPAMSHLIIIGHVKDGIEMAKEYGLPANLHAFIPEHHGTCVIEYFYHAASEARKPGDPEIPDTEFRYPGPKPQSRETAIVMLCDGVEGAVRAMSEPTPNRIEDTVERIMQKRLIDGQFDECDLTFRELHIIRNSLVKSLSGLYHGRISYPSTEKDAEARTAS